jgi:hypothetical protein
MQICSVAVTVNFILGKPSVSLVSDLGDLYLIRDIHHDSMHLHYVRVLKCCFVMAYVPTKL